MIFDKTITKKSSIYKIYMNGRIFVMNGKMFVLMIKLKA